MILSSPESAKPNTGADSRTVVLVHGIWCKAFVMHYLAWKLRRQGFRCHCFSYASVFRRFEVNAERLRTKISNLNAESLHLVAHSYGGLQLLHMLDVQDMACVRRIALLGSPERGAELARSVRYGRIRRRLLGYAGERLAKGLPDDVIQRAASLHPLGVISGTHNVTLLGLLFGGIEQGDGLVAKGETHIPGALEVSLPVSHAGMLLSPSVAKQVSRFLGFGEFHS